MVRFAASPCPKWKKGFGQSAVRKLLHRGNGGDSRPSKEGAHAMAADGRQPLTGANIKYPLALNKLCRDKDRMRSVHIAEKLGITKSSVHTMLKALREMGLIHKDASGIHLTPRERRWPGGMAAIRRCCIFISRHLFRTTAMPERRLPR